MLHLCNDVVIVLNDPEAWPKLPGDLPPISTLMAVRFVHTG
jgi:hypothetical protein